MESGCAGRQEGGVKRLISRPAIVLYVWHPQVMCKGQTVSCPGAAHKTETYRSLRFLELAALVPSAGTITPQIDLRLGVGAIGNRVWASSLCLRLSTVCSAEPSYGKPKGASVGVLQREYETGRGGP